MFYIYADGVSIYDPSNPAYLLFEPRLTVEFGKAGSLEFSIPKNNVYYNSLRQLKTVVNVTLDGVEIFRGRVLNYSTDFRNFKQVYCEGNLSYLVDSVQKGDKYEGTTHDLFRRIIAAHNSRVEAYKRFTVGNITIEDRSVSLTGRDENPDENDVIDYKQIALNSITDEWNNSFDYIQTCLIDYCGGYLKTRQVGNTTYIDLLASYTSTAAQEVEFGVNLLDLKQEISEEELFTVLIPLGDDNLTVASVNGGSDEIVDTNAVSEYGRIVRTQVFSNVTNPSTLLENGRRYLSEHTNVPISITVNAVDLHLIDSSVTALQVGQRVHINSSPHNIVEYLTCTKIEYDLSNPENTSYTFGNPKQTLTQRYREDKRAQNDTYGNGIDGGGYGGYASGLGAVGRAQAAVIDKKNQDLKNGIKEEWINIDPNNPDGVGSIGGLYRVLKDHQNILEQTVGIDFNAPEGNINMHALAEITNQNTGKIQRAEAKTEETAAVIDGKLTAISKSIASVETELGEKTATWELFASETESAIRGKADKFDVEAIQSTIHGEFEKTNDRFNVLKTVGIDVDAQTGNINILSLSQKVDDNNKLIRENTATIQTKTTELTSSVQMVARTTVDHESKIASVTALTTQLGSLLELKADKTVVDGDLSVINGTLTALEGEIDILKAKKITADEIRAALAIMDRVAVRNLTASTISSPSINISDTDGGGVYPVASRNYVDAAVNRIGTGGNQHSHEISVADDGTVTFGYATSDPQYFNVTATRAYRNGVAAAQRAVKINELGRIETSTDTYNSTTHATTVHLQAATEFGKTKTADIVVSGTKAYQDGYSDGATEAADAAYQRGFNDVDFDRLVVDVSGITFPYDSSRETQNIRIPYTIYLENGNDYTGAVSTDITSFYISTFNSGRSGVTIRSLVRDPNQADSYDSSAHNTTIHVIATASNNNTLSGSFTTGTEAYDNGHTAGYSLGHTTGKNAVKVDSIDITESHSVGNKKVTVTTVARLSNGKTGSNSKTISTVDHYNAGVNSVTISSLAFGTPVHDTTNKTVTVNATATPSNDVNGNKRLTNTITIPTASHYNAGFNKAKTDYNPTSINVTDSQDTSKKQINLSYNAKNAAGTVLISGTKVISAEGHYNTGYNKAKADYNPTVVNISDSHSTSKKQITLSYNAKNAAGGTLISGSKTISTEGHFNAGKTEGINSVILDSVSQVTSSSFTPAKSVSIGDSYITYSASTLSGGVNVKLSNEKTSIVRVQMNATKAYNAGKTAGTNSVGVNSISFKNGTGYADVNIGLSSGTTVTKSLPTIYDGTDQVSKTLYNYAYDLGKRSVSVSSVAFKGGTSYADVNITLSNGTTTTKSLPKIYDSTDQVSKTLYNYAYDLGKRSVSVSVNSISFKNGTGYADVNIALSSGTTVTKSLPTIYDGTDRVNKTLYNYAYDLAKRAYQVTDGPTVEYQSRYDSSDEIYYDNYRAKVTYGGNTYYSDWMKGKQTTVYGPWVEHESRWIREEEAYMDCYRAVFTYNGTTYYSDWSYSQMTNAWQYGYNAGVSAGFGKGGYRSVYVLDHTNYSARVGGYYYASYDSDYMSYISSGWVSSDAEYPALSFN